MVMVLLGVPIYVLYHLVSDVGTNRAYAICIGILLIFTLTFSAMLSLFTRAKRHEIFGAAAAYVPYSNSYFVLESPFNTV